MISTRVLEGAPAMCVVAAVVGSYGCGARSPLGDADPTIGPETPAVTENPLCLPTPSYQPPSVPVLLFSGEIAPSPITVHATGVYWANWYFGSPIYRTPLTGGSSEPVTDEQRGVNRIVAHGAGIVWVEHGLSSDDGGLNRLDLPAGSTTKWVSGLTRPQGVSLRGSTAYFTDGYGPPSNATNGRVRRVIGNAAVPETLASGLYDPWGIAVTGSHVYFTDIRAGGEDGEVLSIPIDGGPVTEVDSELRLPYHIVAHRETVYWATHRSNGRVMMLEEGGAPELLATGQSGISDMAADDTGVTWLAHELDSEGNLDGILVRATSEGDVQTLRRGLGEARGIAVDATAIYWTSESKEGVGRIMMLCKRP